MTAVDVTSMCHNEMDVKCSGMDGCKMSSEDEGVNKHSTLNSRRNMRLPCSGQALWQQGSVHTAPSQRLGQSETFW